MSSRIFMSRFARWLRALWRLQFALFMVLLVCALLVSLLWNVGISYWAVLTHCSISDFGNVDAALVCVFPLQGGLLTP